MNTLQKLYEEYGVHSDYLEIPDVGRADLSKWLNTLNFRVGVEVGVAFGKYARRIMRNNPGMTLYGIDPWVQYQGYNDYQKKGTYDRMLKEIEETVKAYPNFKVIKEFSVDAVKRFKDNSIDFVYIDGNHSHESVLEDMEIWTPKVRKDGIVAGHDFTNRLPAVKRAVMEYVKRNDIKLMVLGLESKKSRSLVRDSSRSWLFVR